MSMTEVLNKAKTVWGKTEGYKTAAGGFLLMMFDLFTLTFPHALNGSWNDWTQRFINFVIFTGVLDKLWRKREVIAQKVKDWLSDKFKHKEKDG